MRSGLERATTPGQREHQRRSALRPGLPMGTKVADGRLSYAADNDHWTWLDRLRRGCARPRRLWPSGPGVSSAVPRRPRRSRQMLSEILIRWVPNPSTDVILPGYNSYQPLASSRELIADRRCVVHRRL